MWPHSARKQLAIEAFVIGNNTFVTESALTLRTTPGSIDFTDPAD
jgi:hypothetical protein